MRWLISLMCALWLALLAARVMELLLLFTAGNLPDVTITFIGGVLILDIACCLKLLLPLGLLIAVSRAVIRRRSTPLWSFGLAASLILLLHSVLINYYATALVPLGSDLFGYSLADIRLTFKSGAVVDVLSVLILLVPLFAFWTVLPFFAARRPGRWLAMAVLAMSGVSLFVPAGILDAAFPTEQTTGVAVNKIAYFIDDITRYATSSWSIGTGDSLLSDAGDAADDFDYLDPEFPFLRTDTTPDVLGPFFNVDPARPPNLVFIVVEGLGRAFSGTRAYLGSYTPFLDDLRERSLVWDNFLAPQGRTFAMLPSLFGSLPFGKNGFLALGEVMPPHHTLLSILRNQGYHLRYYLGSDLEFDNQLDFLKRQKVDVLIGEDDFGPEYQRSPGCDGGEGYWGFADLELMRKALSIEQASQHQPFVTVVQTMSMHTPYLVPGQERYLELFEGRLDELNFSPERRARRQSHRDIYSTIMYTDDALRFFFREYAKLPAYGNTIFIVTGDHRLPEIPLSTRIDRYHVPFIIFSPLLKGPARFRSVSSQFDVTPSLMAFLHHGYGLRTPSAVCWLGSGLDTEPTFRNIHRIPMKHTTTNLIDYISGLSFINKNQFYDVREHLRIKPVKDKKRLQQVRREFERFKKRNDRFERSLKLIPYSVYDEFP